MITLIAIGTGSASAGPPLAPLPAQPPIAVAGVLRAVIGAEHLPLEDALRIERRRSFILESERASVHTCE